VYETVEHPSVSLSIRPIIRLLHTTLAGLLMLALQPSGIDRLLHGRHSAANASIVKLSADVGS